MHFINDNVGRTCQRRTLVLGPSFGIGLAQVDDGSTFAVHAYCLGIDTGRIALPLSAYLDVERIELTFQVFLHFSLPGAFLGLFHADGFVGMPAFASLVKHQAHFVGCRCPQRKPGCLGCILHLGQTAGANRIKFKRSVFVLGRSTTDNCGCRYSNDYQIVQLHHTITNLQFHYYCSLVSILSPYRDSWR